MINISILKSLIDDIPFAIHLVREEPGKMFGRDATYYLKEFERLIRNPPWITLVGGTPGSGKSYCISNLSNYIKKNPSRGYVVTIRLTERKFSAENLFSLIQNEIGVPVSELGELLEEEKKVLCLLIDNVDEYIRYWNYFKEISNESIFLNILRTICSMEQSLHGRFCAVLSITDYIINILHLLQLNDSQNIIMSLSAGDRNIRDRFHPITDPKDNEKLLLFKGFETKDDAAKMIEDCMNSWKHRHPNDWPEKIPDQCIYTVNESGINNEHVIYPFDCDALDILFKASGSNPGEVILGAISSIQQLFEITDFFSKNYDKEDEIPIINEAIAILGIFQIKRMNIKLLESVNDLDKKLQTNSSVVYSYYIPQLANELKLKEIEIRKDLGEAFIDFLKRIGLTIEDIFPKVVFGRTRGVVEPPDIPLFDAKFSINNKRFGVVFLIPPFNHPTNLSRLKTGEGILRSGGAGQCKNIQQEIDSLLIICSDESVANWAIEKVNSSFYIGNRDFKICTSVIKVSENWPWILKVLNNKLKGDSYKILLSEDNIKTQSILLERTSAYFWESNKKSDKVEPTSWNSLRWNEILKKVETEPWVSFTSPSYRPFIDMPTG